MESLKGKSLESLARLGGHNFLSLPSEFAPTSLRLPACFVEIITVLMRHGIILWPFMLLG